MNDGFVCIKVDRESGRMSIGPICFCRGDDGQRRLADDSVLTPDLKPFFGGTLFSARRSRMKGL
jgi:uncharacterized protein YyaL (SSP411 family)